MDLFKKELIKALIKITKLKEENILTQLEIPPDKVLGDLAFPCFILAKELKKSPNEIARNLFEKIPKLKYTEKIKVEGPYINFFTNNKKLAEITLKNIKKEKDKYGSSKQGKKQKIMIEYSAPNTNKPLHLGHLRNDSIGMSISNLLEFNNYKIIRANLFSNHGIHICKSMLAYQKFGKNKKPDIKTDHFVGKYYVMFEQKKKENPELEEEAYKMLRKWETKDKEVRKLWEKMDNWAINGFKETYKKFGSKFDVYFKESDFYYKAKPIIDKGIKQKIFYKDEEGNIIINLEPYDLPKKVILRADGTSVYITNDLVLTEYKFRKYKLKKAIWVVGSEQNLYHKQHFKIFELLGYEFYKDCYHLSYGMVFLPEGKMKSREGRVVDADDLISEITELSQKEILKRGKDLLKNELKLRSEKIALAAIKFFLLKIDPNKDIYFDPKQSVSFEGETGPYIQYTYARANSILRKDKKKSNKIDYSLIKEEEEIELIKLLSKFPEIVLESSNSYRPSLVCRYLLDLSQKFNEFYQKYPVLKANKELTLARLSLVESTKQVIKNGLYLLNIEVLEKM